MRYLLLPLWLHACAADKAADSTCLVCPDLVGKPCNNGADPAVDYAYCDPCGETWRCKLTGAETHDFLDWSASSLPCACVKPDGTLDTTNTACVD